MIHNHNGEEWDCDEYYPQFGVAPHVHVAGLLGATIVDDKNNWPGYFTEDPDAPGLGTYTCPVCYKEKKAQLEFPA